MKEMQICQLCNEKKKLAEAHIIPKKFYKNLRTSKQASVLVTYENIKEENKFARDKKTKKSQQGIYDKNILCKECDNRLGKFDQYGIELLLHSKDKFVRKFNHFKKREIEKFILNDFDYKMLQIFLISILWRASITDNISFNTVNLGELEDEAKTILLTENLENNIFECIIFKLYNKSSIPHLEDTVFTPVEYSRSGIKCLAFYFGGYEIYIKIDRMEFSTKDKIMKLTKNKPLTMTPKAIEDTDVYKRMLAT